MNETLEAAIYAAFCEEFAQCYRQPNDALRERVWAATKNAGLDSVSKKLLRRALEIATEQEQVTP